MEGAGNNGTKIKFIVAVLIIVLCCLASTILSFTVGPKMPVIGEPENKSVLIGTNVCYVICTLICILVLGLVIYISFKSRSN